MIDFGNTGGNGPFLSWQARASLDGEFPAKSWVLRLQSGKVACPALARGVVFDIDNIKLGWSRGDGAPGVAPEWKWNPSLSRFEPKPGDDWKRGFCIPVLLNATETAVWEQAQAGAFSAVQELFGLIGKAKRQAGFLPVVKHSGETKIESKRGMTFAPKLEIVKWIARPEALDGGAGPAFAPAPLPQAAAPAPSRQPVMAGVEDDDIPFAPEFR